MNLIEAIKKIQEREAEADRREAAGLFGGMAPATESPRVSLSTQHSELSTSTELEDVPF